MDFLNLNQLKNLSEMKRLDELQRLDQLQHLDKLDKLDKLDNLQQLQTGQGLGQLQHLQSLNQLQKLDKLQDLHDLAKLQHLDLLKYMQGLDRLHHLDRLQQLQLLNRMTELERLNRLTELRRLGGLDQLDQMRSLHELPSLAQLQHMDALNKLNQLEVLNRLSILDRILAFNYATFLYLLSFFVPGLIFEESLAFFLGKKAGWKRSLVLIIAYNILSLLVCIVLVYPALTSLFMRQMPVAYYGVWLAVLLVVPLLLGWGVAQLMRLTKFGKPWQEILVSKSTAVANAWERFLSGADTYQIVVTLNNERKIKGIFNRGMPVPETGDPNGIYLNETSYCNPDTAEWRDLDHPTGIWVKGSEIKTVEVSPESSSPPQT